MVMLLLVIDTETTGVERAADHLIEWAAALYSVEERAILWAHSAIVPSTDTNPPDAALVNHITDAMLVVPWTERESLLPLVGVAGETGVPLTAIAAHNAEFDRAFVERAMFPFHRHGKPIPWIDTRSDITYPRARGSQHLSHICADHGIPAVQAHRALSDVLMLCELLGKVDDLEAQIAQALLPRALFESLQPFEENHLAKAHGFGYSVPPGYKKKMWWRKLPADTECEPTAERPFELRRIG
jgi:DNA polymerase III epsilon subunit-like protein